MNNNLLVIFCLLAFSQMLTAQDLSGNWLATYDQNVEGKMLKDKDFGVVELKPGSDGAVSSTIKTLLNGFNTTCMKCPATYMGKPSIGLVWCKGLKPVPGRKGEFEGGWAIDFQTGETIIDVRIKTTGQDTMELSGKSESKGGVVRTFKLRRQ